MKDTLTKTQTEILEMYTVKKYTISQIANRRQTTKRAVYKILRELRQKGWLEKHSSQKAMPSIMPLSKRYYRLHNLHYKVTPYYYYERYEKNIGKTIFYGKWVIHVNQRSLEFQTQAKKSFDSKDLNECPRLARESFIKAIIKMQERVGCEIIKDQKMNIELVNHHIAEVNNGIARLVQDKKLFIMDENGMIWAIIDKSLKVLETETIDPKYALDDARALEKHYNAMRKPEVMTNEELQVIVTEFAKNMQTHVKVMKRIDKTIDRFNNILKRGDMRFLSQPSRPRPSQQLSLQSFIG